MIEPLTITLPFPPSVNRYWRAINGRNVLSAEGRQYRLKVSSLCYRVSGFDNRRLEVIIVANPPDNRRRDLDNLCKATLDCMQHAGLYDDDSQIDRLTIARGAVVKGGGLTVILREAQSC